MGRSLLNENMLFLFYLKRDARIIELFARILPRKKKITNANVNAKMGFVPGLHSTGLILHSA